ncbi:MAG: PAS domain-containing protein [Bacteroidales bacterium]|nr:PAS domain-containing protein [Bacteroidales bacterium]
MWPFTKYSLLKQQNQDLRQEVLRLTSILDQNGPVSNSVTNCQEKAQLISVFNLLPFRCWLKDTYGKYLLVNKQFVKNMQLKASDVVGLTDNDLYPPEMAERFAKDDLEVKATQKVHVYKETRDDRSYESYKAPVIDFKGEIFGTCGIERDITYQKEIYNFLKDERAYLTALMDYIPFTIILKTVKASLPGLTRPKQNFWGSAVPKRR